MSTFLSDILTDLQPALQVGAAYYTGREERKAQQAEAARQSALAAQQSADAQVRALANIEAGSTRTAYVAGAVALAILGVILVRKGVI